MAGTEGKIRVAVNGYGVIGKRVADAVGSQDDMEVVGVADIETDWRVRNHSLGFVGLGQIDVWPACPAA